MLIGAAYIGCLGIHRTRVTAYKSTTNNVVFFFVSDLKIEYYSPMVRETWVQSQVEPYQRL